MLVTVMIVLILLPHACRLQHNRTRGSAMVVPREGQQFPSRTPPTSIACSVQQPTPSRSISDDLQRAPRLPSPRRADPSHPHPATSCTAAQNSTRAAGEHRQPSARTRTAYSMPLIMTAATARTDRRLPLVVRQCPSRRRGTRSTARTPSAPTTVRPPRRPCRPSHDLPPTLHGRQLRLSTSTRWNATRSSGR